jgi:hypothetical protein
MQQSFVFWVWEYKYFLYARSHAGIEHDVLQNLITKNPGQGRVPEIQRSTINYGMPPENQLGKGTF